MGRVSDVPGFDPHLPTDRTEDAFGVVQELMAAFLLAEDPDVAARTLGDLSGRLLADQQLLWETFLYLGWLGSVALIELGRCRDLDTTVVAVRLIRALRRQALGEGPAWGGSPAAT